MDVIEEVLVPLVVDVDVGLSVCVLEGDFEDVGVCVEDNVVVEEGVPEVVRVAVDVALATGSGGIIFENPTFLQP